MVYVPLGAQDDFFSGLGDVHYTIKEKAGKYIFAFKNMFVSQHVDFLLAIIVPQNFVDKKSISNRNIFIYSFLASIKKGDGRNISFYF